MTIGEKLNIPNIFKYGVLVLSLVFSYSLINNLREIYGSEKEVEEVRERLYEAQLEKEKAVEELEYLSSEAYAEKQARDRLGLAKEGEVVVVLPEKEVLRRLAPETSEDGEEFLPDPYWKRWWDMFI